MELLGWIGAFIFLFTFTVFSIHLKEEIYKIIVERAYLRWKRGFVRDLFQRNDFAQKGGLPRKNYDDPPPS